MDTGNDNIHIVKVSRRTVNEFTVGNAKHAEFASTRAFDELVTHPQVIILKCDFSCSLKTFTLCQVTDTKLIATAKIVSRLRSNSDTKELNFQNK